MHADQQFQLHPIGPVAATPTGDESAPPPQYTLVYQCRLCATKFDAYPVEDGIGTLKSILAVTNQVAAASGGPATRPLSQRHDCPDGGLGVADVVGVRKLDAAKA
jgi:hypothetical protein